MGKIKKNKKIIILTLIMYLILFLVIVFKVQDAMFFAPWHDVKAYEELQKIDEFKEIKINNDEINLSGWFWNIQNKDEKAPLVIFFTGNAQNSSNVLYNYYSNNMREIFGKYNLMIIDYPGYGISKGKPSDTSMFLGSNYIFDYATKMDEVDKDNIVIMGYSIGTGVATYCASNNNANGLILIAPYDKAINLYNDTVNIFHGPLKILAKYEFDSIKYANNVKENTLIITSKADELINYKHSVNLSNYFANLDDIVILEDVRHADYLSQATVLNRITEFLNKSLK